jgi:hypothetical protein
MRRQSAVNYPVDRKGQHQKEKRLSMFRNPSSVIAVAALSVAMLGTSAMAARAPKSFTNGAVPSHPGSWTSPREASVTLPSFNQVVFNEAGGGLDEESVLLTGIPAGTYTGYTVTVDWDSSVGDAWSSEAIWAFTNGPTVAGSSVFYADPGPAVDSFDDPLPASLSWTGFFDTPYTAPTNGNMYMLMAQSFGGSGATWNNVSVTLSDASVTPPASTTAVLGGSLSAPIATSEVLWYSFNYSGSGAINLDTAGSTLTASTFGEPDDTEIALYSAAGALIETNDDTDFTNGILTSSLSYASGELPAGTYYVAVTGFNGVFAGAFAASSTSISEGTIFLSGLSIPEPTSLAALSMVGLVARRRRSN